MTYKAQYVNIMMSKDKGQKNKLKLPQRLDGGKELNMDNLKEIKKIRINDFSEYVAEKSRDGGCYGFWVEYDNINDDNWEISYHTTADMPYCPCCGSFNDHRVQYDEDDIFESGYSCGEFNTIKDDELLKLITDFKESDDQFIEVIKKEDINDDLIIDIE